MRAASLALLLAAGCSLASADRGGPRSRMPVGSVPDSGAADTGVDAGADTGVDAGYPGDDYAVRLDGVDEYLSAASTTLTLQDAGMLTLAMRWTRAASPDATAYSVSKYESTARTGFYWNTQVTGENQAAAPLDNTGTTDRVSFDAGPTSTKLYGCLVYDLSQATQADKIKLYRAQGTASATTQIPTTVIANTGTTIRTNTTIFAIGSLAGTSNFSAIDVGDLIVFDEALTKAECDELITTGGEQTNPELHSRYSRVLAWWAMGDSNGDSTATDGGIANRKDGSLGNLSVNNTESGDIVAW